MRDERREKREERRGTRGAFLTILLGRSRMQVATYGRRMNAKPTVSTSLANCKDVASFWYLQAPRRFQPHDLRNMPLQHPSHQIPTCTARLTSSKTCIRSTPHVSDDVHGDGWRYSIADRLFKWNRGVIIYIYVYTSYSEKCLLGKNMPMKAPPACLPCL